jgi:hypothetical protein
MFWSEDELEELKGSLVLGKQLVVTSILFYHQTNYEIHVEKIGKAEAEADYTNLVATLVKASL